MASLDQLVGEGGVEGEIGGAADRDVHQYPLSFTPAGTGGLAAISLLQNHGGAGRDIIGFN